MTLLNKQFISFDGSNQITSQLIRPDSYSFFADEKVKEKNLIARGAGLSYTAASFGENTISVDQSNFNRILDFNKEEQWIEVESGMTLGQLYEFLIKHHLFLASQPGHPSISIGGCIASDIHGKNQFIDGTFINQVFSLRLYHPSCGIIEINQNNNPSLFRLTCGGYGLTGNIISAKLKLKPIPSAYAEVSLIPLDNLFDLVSKMKSLANDSDFIYSWHDFSRKDNTFGAGFIQRGNFLQLKNCQESLKKSIQQLMPTQTLSSESRSILPIPIFNKFTISLMNKLFGSKINKSSTSFRLSLFDSIFPIQNSKELYFKFFGSLGFHEYQVLIPELFIEDYFRGIKELIIHFDIPVTLASAKLFRGTQELLRFTGNGICFALNFPRQKDSIQLLAELDRLLISCKGIPNIIKDSRLSKDTIDACYPEAELFRKLIKDFDPNRLYRSELSERLSL